MAEHYGRVTANSGLRARNKPSVSAGSLTTLPSGYVVSIDCKIDGEDVDGNNIWYFTDYGWLSARYVANVGDPPDSCGPIGFEPYSGQALTGLNARSGPGTSHAVTRVLAKGDSFIVDCKRVGETILGNEYWYRTEDGDWVSAAWVYDFSSFPGDC